MSDYIKREDAIKQIVKGEEMYGEEFATDTGRVKDFLNVLPPADVVEVVRCKDCEYYVCKPGYLINSIEDCMCYCKRIECGAVLIPVKDYDFCSRGIKRKEQENG